MKDFGTVKSAVRPESMVVDEYNVWVHTDIQETTETDPMTGDEINGFQFHKVQYEKDEYIHMMADQNSAMEADLTNTQMALCDVYELLEGLGG